MILSDGTCKSMSSVEGQFNYQLLQNQFKQFFTNHGYKVRKEGAYGMKATNENTSLTFYFWPDAYAGWFQEENGIDCEIYAKLPYTDYNLVRFQFKFAEDALPKIFADPDFLKMLDYKLPYIGKKIK